MQDDLSLQTKYKSLVLDKWSPLTQFRVIIRAGFSFPTRIQTSEILGVAGFEKYRSFYLM